MTMFGRVGAVVGATTAVLATSWLFVSVLMGRTRSWFQVDAVILAWVAFGAALAAAVRWMPRKVAAGASLALAGIGLADLLLEPFGRVAWIATSEYLWIALAALAFNGLTPDPSGRSAQDDLTSAHRTSISG